MKYILFILLFSCKLSSAQQWHHANEILKKPKSHSGYYPTILYLDTHDTVPIIYKVVGDTTLYNGYKAVYLYNGFFTDDKYTIGAFYNSEMKRINTVSLYYFTGMNF